MGRFSLWNRFGAIAIALMMPALALGTLLLAPAAALADDVGLEAGALSVQDASGSGSVRPMFREYNPYSGEHFYTADVPERAGLVMAGWDFEGAGWYAPTSGEPVYRLYNPYVGDHHYTLDASERDSLVAVGWTDEGVGWLSAGSDGVPLYREYNPNEPACNHNYTTDKAEHDYLVSLGWRDEGYAWYGV